MGLWSRLLEPFVSSTHCHGDRGGQYGGPGGRTEGWELHSALSSGGETGRTSLHMYGMELSAVRVMLGSLEEVLLGQVIRIESDNTMIVFYIFGTVGLSSGGDRSVGYFTTGTGLSRYALLRFPR